MVRLFLFCGLLFLVIGCTDVEPLNPEALGLKYYPLQAGNYWTYQVTETRYKEQFAEDAADSITYFIQERIDTVFKDLTGEDTYKFTRYRRLTNAEEWGQDSVFVVNKSISVVRLTQNNQRVVCFIFPVTEGKQWNAHIFNSNSNINSPVEASYYSFSNVAKPTIVNGVNYSNTVKVNQLLINNAIEHQDLHELYAHGIGRILKQKVTYKYCSDPDRQNGCAIGKNFIITGKKITEKLIDNGYSR